MKNKFGNNIHLVKLELSSTSTRQNLINAKKLIVNYISYDVIEFLSPATVLICSKCSGIGHFRKQCTEQNDTCKTCAQAFTDLKNHHCTADPICKHCSGNPLSNSTKCPVIKSFRAELTRKILNTNHQHHHPSSSSAKNNNNNYVYNSLNFPPLPAPQTSSNNSVLSKLDDLMTRISEVKDHLANLSSKHDKFEQFMLEKAQHDTLIMQQMDGLKLCTQELKTDLVQHQILLERHENMFVKLLFPMFEDVLSHIVAINYDNKGRVLDADLKSRLERYLIQVKKSRESKQCLA